MIFLISGFTKRVQAFKIQKPFPAFQQKKLLQIFSDSLTRLAFPNHLSAHSDQYWLFIDIILYKNTWKSQSTTPVQ